MLTSQNRIEREGEGDRERERERGERENKHACKQIEKGVKEL